jgi:hypothetical protein
MDEQFIHWKMVFNVHICQNYGVKLHIKLTLNKLKVIKSSTSIYTLLGT